MAGNGRDPGDAGTETLGTSDGVRHQHLLAGIRMEHGDTSFSPLQESLSGGPVKLSLNLEDSCWLYSRIGSHSVSYVRAAWKDTNGNRQSEDSSPSGLPTPPPHGDQLSVRERPRPSPHPDGHCQAPPPSSTDRERTPPSPGSPSLTLTAPQAGEEILAGQAYKIQWRIGRSAHGSSPLPLVRRG